MEKRDAVEHLQAKLKKLDVTLDQESGDVTIKSKYQTLSTNLSQNPTKRFIKSVIRLAKCKLGSYSWA